MMQVTDMRYEDRDRQIADHTVNSPCLHNTRMLNSESCIKVQNHSKDFCEKLEFI